MLEDIRNPTYRATRLVEMIRIGEIAMPDFQRDFVWRPKHVMSLLASVANRWPIGALLISDRVENSHIEALELKQFDGTPEIRKNNVKYIVLDGQQRLTSLLHSFAVDCTDTIYYVEDIISMFRTCYRDDYAHRSLSDDDFSSLPKAKFDGLYPTIEKRAQAGVALIADIYDSPSFTDWHGYLTEEQWPYQKSELDKCRRAIFGEMEEYRISSLTLDADLGLEPLAVIFETVNKTGIRLDVDDLMLAKLYPSGFHLHEKWDDALDSHSGLQLFGDVWKDRAGKGAKPITSLHVLRLISFWQHGAIKRGDILNLEPETVQNRWEEATNALELALNFLKDECGVAQSGLLPEDAMVLTIAAYLNSTNQEGFGLLKTWFWRSIVDETYQQGTSTRPVADANALIAGRLPTDINDDNFNTEIKKTVVNANMLEQRRRHDIMGRGVAALLVDNGALDWKSERRVDRCDDSIEIHHIFPMRYSTNQAWVRKGQANPVNIVANLTPLTATSNKAISSSPPNAAFEEYEEAIRVLDAHFVDESAFEVSELAEFGEFARCRAEKLTDLLLARC